MKDDSNQGHMLLNSGQNGKHVGSSDQNSMNVDGNPYNHMEMAGMNSTVKDKEVAGMCGTAIFETMSAMTHVENKEPEMYNDVTHVLGRAISACVGGYEVVQGEQASMSARGEPDESACVQQSGQGVSAVFAASQEQECACGSISDGVTQCVAAVAVRNMAEWNYEIVDNLTLVMKYDNLETYNQMGLANVNMLYKVNVATFFVVTYVLEFIKVMWMRCLNMCFNISAVGMLSAVVFKENVVNGTLVTRTSLWSCWMTSLLMVFLMSHLGRWTNKCMKLMLKTRPMTRNQKKELSHKRIQCRLQLKILLFYSCACRGAAMEGQPVGEQAFLSQMSTLAQAATSAATAAERALALVASGGASSSASTAETGMSAASRILKSPDTFSGDDGGNFLGWKFTFTNWLCYGDNRFEDAFRVVEALSADQVMPKYTTAQAEMSSKLYSILSSYLKGRCLTMVRSFQKSRDGLALWRELHREFLPSTRQRSLAIAQTLASYPPFNKEKSVMEQILQYEQLVGQFEELAATKYPDELKSATLIRCAETKLREHLQLTVRDSTSFAQLKDLILGYEQASRSWNSETVLKSLQNNPTGADDGGSRPMEVDRVEEKGKYKGGKKGKKGSWQSYAGGFLGYKGGKGKQNQNGKGKGGRGKGKGGFQKGKNKGKNKSGGKQKGKANGKRVDAQQCRICYGYGHWSKECPQRVNQVVQEQQQPYQQPPQAQQPFQPSPTSTIRTTVPLSSTSTSTVRRIYNIPMGIPTLTSSSGVSSVRMISEYTDQSEPDVVILDSGSDVSLLPLHYGEGQIQRGAQDVHLRDCQGERLRVDGYRTVSLLVTDVDGSEAEIEHCFLIGDVKSCILSLGQLYQHGWNVKHDGGILVLKSADSTLNVPVFFQRNSLAINATVCRIEECEQIPCVASVRAIMELEDKFRPDVIRSNQWETIVEGKPFMRTIGTDFVDPRVLWGLNFKYRSTFIQKVETAEVDSGWCIAEVSRNYVEMDDAFGRIPEIDTYGQGEPCVILTILSESNDSLREFGELLDQGGLDVQPEPESPRREEAGDAGEEEIIGMDIPELQQLAPVLNEQEEGEDKIIVGEMEINESSAVRDLQAAARYLQVSSSGSKRKIYERIKKEHLKSLRMSALHAARQQYEVMIPEPRFQDAPAQPSERERRLHELTHLPFKAWCSFCVMAKSKNNSKRATRLDDVAERTHPTIQVDFYTAVGNLSVLIIVDTWTKYVGTEPMKNRLASVVGNITARFLANMGYFEEVEIAHDGEPVLSAGMKYCQLIRQNNGLVTHLQPGHMYGKARTSLAERAISSVRNQAKTLIAYVEDKIKAKLKPDHVLHSWAIIHAAWLLNRFHIANATGVTAFMAVRGRPYKGRICNFGSEVYALDALRQKYQSQWRPGIWLTKDESDHDVVCVGPNEVLRSKAIRRVEEKWNGEAIIAMSVGPWDMQRGVHTQVTPDLPRVQPVPQVPVLPGGVEPEFDQDAADVMKYALENPHDEDEEGTRSEQGGALEVPEQQPMLGENQGIVEEQQSQSSLPEKRGGAEDLKLPVSVRQRVEEAESSKRNPDTQTGGPAKFVRFDPEAPVPEPSTKQARTEMYSPTFAGNVSSSPSSGSGHVRQIIDDLELYDEDENEPSMPIDSTWDADFGYELRDDSAEGVAISAEDRQHRGFHNEEAGPPTVSTDELTCLDHEAMLVELDRLRSLDVIEDVQEAVCEKGEEPLLLDTRLVFDWRYREGEWKRRARLVAREFKGNSAGSSDTFAPTSPLPAVRILLVLCLLRSLALAVMDVSDAFLQVNQKEYVLVEVPTWMKKVMSRVQQQVPEFFRLKKCLPGQRNAANRWNEYFGSICSEHDFVNYQGGTIYKHKEKDAFLSIHIDDILLVAPKEFCVEFHSSLGKKLKVKMDGPLHPDEDGTVFYLKRQIEMDKDGLSIAVNSKYIPKLVEMLNVTDRRGKSTPGQTGLNVYDAEVINESEYLPTKEAKLFRSGLGVCLYVALERMDIQHTVRILASYMARPTKAAMSGLKRLTSYLNQTKDVNMRFPKIDVYQNVFNRWNHCERATEKKAYQLEMFSDSDWATCRSTRRSTSSGVIFLNGCCIHSHSRAQQSIALSSMEAEILAATSLLVEGMYLKQVLQFLVGEPQDLSSNRNIECKLYVDSTSAQSFFERLGPGRAKHLATRIMWTQQAVRRSWFSIHRISTQENVADLNTKCLSAERRKYLMVKMGYTTESWQEDDEQVQDNGQNRVMKQMVRAITALMAATSLQGCGVLYAGEDGTTTSSSSTRWMSSMMALVVFFFAIVLMAIGLLYYKEKYHKTMEELKKYKEVWSSIREAMKLKRRQDPLTAEEDHEELVEEENATSDETFPNSTDEEMDEAARYRLMRRRLVNEANHGADEPDDDENGSPPRAMGSAGLDPPETARSRTPPGFSDVPQAKTMPKALQDARAREEAMHWSDMVAQHIIEQAEQDSEGVLQHSTNVMSWYLMDPVPRNSSALSDYRWEAINGGLGPEVCLIKEMNNLRGWIERVTNPKQKHRGKKLLKHLQDLLVQLQRGDSTDYFRAACELKNYADNGSSLDHFSPFSSESEGTTRVQQDDDRTGDHSDQRDNDSRDGEDEDADEGSEYEGETNSEMLARYRNATMDEVSDPDLWADLHYGARSESHEEVEEAEEEPWGDAVPTDDENVYDYESWEHGWYEQICAGCDRDYLVSIPEAGCQRLAWNPAVQMTAQIKKCTVEPDSINVMLWPQWLVVQNSEFEILRNLLRGCWCWWPFFLQVNLSVESPMGNCNKHICTFIFKNEHIDFLGSSIIGEVWNKHMFTFFFNVWTPLSMRDHEKSSRKHSFLVLWEIANKSRTFFLHRLSVLAKMFQQFSERHVCAACKAFVLLTWFGLAILARLSAWLCVMHSTQWRALHVQPWGHCDTTAT